MSVSVDDIGEKLREFVGDIDPTTKKGLKRLSIIESATRMFAERGYRKTSMDELASEVGVAKGTLYLYFPKKIDLLMACGAREKLRWMPELSGMMDADIPAVERLKQWVVSVLLLPSRSPLISRLMNDREMAAMLADYPSDLLEESQDLYPQFMQSLLDEVAGEHRWNAVELRDRAYALRAISHISPMLRHEQLRPGMSEERFAAVFADLIVDGIRPRPAPSQEEGPS